MRAAARLLATATRTSQFLEPGAPTGLTGLLTHAAPRSALLYLYSSTLDTLKTRFPESSVYRQSTEALTRHRLAIIESTKPAGLEAWQQRVEALVTEFPGAFKKIPVSQPSGAKDYNIIWQAYASKGAETEEWNEAYKAPPMKEGPRSEAERAGQLAQLQSDPTEQERLIPKIEPEPSLTAGQIEEVEAKIGAGLIEEVIQVAEGEKALAERLAESKVWEELEEPPAPGQWSYFGRDTHTGETQAR